MTIYVDVVVYTNQIIVRVVHERIVSDKLTSRHFASDVRVVHINTEQNDRIAQYMNVMPLLF